MGQNRRQQRDYSDRVRKHPSPSVRAALVLTPKWTLHRRHLTPIFLRLLLFQSTVS